MSRFARLAGAALVFGVMAAPVMAQDLVFTVTNESGVDLVELYTSAADAASWEDNILAGQVLPSGANGEVTITGAGDNCAFDLRMVFSDGDVIEDSTDLCSTAGYTIN